MALAPSCRHIFRVLNMMRPVYSLDGDVADPGKHRHARC